MRAVRLLALCLPLIGTGCDRLTGGGEEEAPAEPAQPEPTPEAPVEATPAGPSVGIELAEPGKEPLAVISATPTAGTQRELVLSMRVSKLGKRKRRLFPYVRATVDSTLEAVADGTSSRKLVLREVELPEADQSNSDEFTQLLGKYRTTLARLAKVDTAALAEASLDAEVDADMRHVMGAIGHAMSHLTAPLPADPIGPGASWTVRRDIDFFGVPTRQTIEYVLEKHEGNQIQITGKATYELVPGTTDAASSGLDLARVSSVSGKTKIDARIDLLAGAPVEMQLRGNVTVAGTNIEDKKRTRRLGLNLRVDENFLAQGDTRVKFDGQFVQGGLVHGVVAPGTKVWFRKKRAKVSPEGDFLIGFGRNSAPRALLSFAFPDGPIERHVVSVGDRVFEPESIDGLPDEMVKLDKDTKRALAKSRKRIDKVRSRSTKVPYFRDGWQWPAKGRITSTYGRRRTLNGVDKGYHWGVDLAAPVGRKVVAPAPGKVVLAEEDVPLSGLLLIIDHGHGLTSSFLHLSEFLVEKGDVVEAGQEIAKVGNTGRSTGPHLDWRMNLFDTRVDPQLLVDGEPPT